MCDDIEVCNTTIRLIAKRINLNNCVEVISIDKFREMMNVLPDSYSQGPSFIKRVVQPALLEVNGLSDFGVAMDLRKNIVEHLFMKLL